MTDIPPPACFFCGGPMRPASNLCYCGAAQCCVRHRNNFGMQTCGEYTRESRVCLVCGRPRLDLWPRLLDVFHRAYHLEADDERVVVFLIRLALLFVYFIIVFFVPVIGKATLCVLAALALYEIAVRVHERPRVGPLLDEMDQQLLTAKQRFERIEDYVEDIVALLKYADEVAGKDQ